MQTTPMEWFGMEAPIFAFSHCRDVVAAVSRNGGFGVLGTTRSTVEELEIDLNWLDEHSLGQPFGVDIMFPSKAPKEFESLTSEEAKRLIPQEHVAFVNELVKAHGLPESTPEENDAFLKWYLEGRMRTYAEGEKRLEVVYKHPNVRMIVSALGVPPQHQIERAHNLGLKVAALVGHPKHVKAHKAAGMDMLMATGYEAGGHTGDIASFVLTPQIVDEAAPIPVLHGGGVGRGRQIAAAMALGAQGVWTGSIWLGTVESEMTPLEREMLFAANSGDTVRTRSGSGKPVRRLRGGFVQAWEREGAPKPLPMPLQSILVEETFKKMEKYQPRSLLSPPAGQVIGMMHHETNVRSVIYDMMLEFGETIESLSALVSER